MPRDRVRWIADVFTEAIPGTHYIEEVPNEAGIWFAAEDPRVPAICPNQLLDRTNGFTDEEFGLVLFGLAEWAKAVIAAAADGEVTPEAIEEAQTLIEHTYPEIGMLLLRAFEEPAADGG